MILKWQRPVSNNLTGRNKMCIITMCGIRVSEVVSRDDCRNVWLNDHEVCKNKISGVPTDILLDLQA